MDYTLRLCPDCADKIGGACSGPDADWIPCDDHRTCDAADCAAWAEEPDYCDDLNAVEHRLSAALRRIRPGSDWADGAWHVRGDAFLTWDGEGWFIVRADSDADGMIFGGEVLLCDADDLDSVRTWIDAGMPVPDLTSPAVEDSING